MTDYDIIKGIASIIIPPENVYRKGQREYNYAATLLTDSTGYVVQALSYLPYGEEWTEYNEMQRPDSLSIGQYRFNGKERDPESGFLYYGQRYYGISYIPMWLSVDPLLDKYPGISPYHYCHWNPIRLIDPDGKEAFENADTWQFNTTTGRLTWINDEGGKSRQTVEMGHSAGKGFVADQTVSFSGDISRMFDGSVISPRVDGMVTGGLDIGTGVSVAGAGLTVGIGGSAISGGIAAPAAAPLGAAMIAAGGTQIILGLKDIMAAVEGAHTTYGQHEMMRDACSLGENFAASAIKHGRKSVKKALKGSLLSIMWGGLKYKHAINPKYKGVPQGSIIKQK